jgi:hypothetical protein
MKEIIQQKIWDYLDGLLSESEAETVEKLITENEEYKTVYAEISILKNSFSAFQVSGSPDNLSKKIMEAYRKQIIKDIKASELKINKKLVKGILFFLIAMPIVVFFIYLIKNGMNFRININGSLIDAIIGNPIVWLLIVFNLIAGGRFVQKRLYLKNKFNL